MDRVVKPGGRVVVGDEGIAPWLKCTEIGEMLINNNPLYACNVPLNLVPVTARDVNLSWVIGNCFYLIEFTSSHQDVEVRLDIPHIGRRGGSIATRFLGQLEGIDPELKSKLYAEAEKRGISRVEMLEGIVKGALGADE